MASPEIRFQIDDETQDPLEVESKKMFETNSMVEEFMLLANITVAEKILSDFPECAVLRRHPIPPDNNFDTLIKAAEHMVNFILIKIHNDYDVLQIDENIVVIVILDSRNSSENTNIKVLSKKKKKKKIVVNNIRILKV